MANSYEKIGGLDWPKGTPEIVANLIIGRFGWSKKYWAAKFGEYKTSVELGSDQPGECMVKAISALLPKHLLDMNRWAERLILSLTDEQETVLLGAAGCGKSIVMSAWSLAWWIPAPERTTIFMSSTSKDGLKRRVWGYLTEQFDYLKKNPVIPIYAVHNRQMCAILNASDDRDDIAASSARSGIFGLAVESGNDTEVAGRIGGAHQSTMVDAPDAGTGSVVMLADECNAMSGAGAFYKAVSNMAVGCDLFRLCSAANPWSGAASNAVGARGTPVHGWQSVDIDSTYQWRSKKDANVIRLDAYDSPGVKDDPIRFGYLPTLESIEILRKEVDYEENDPRFLCMARAMVSDGAVYNSVFPLPLQRKYGVLEDVRFIGEPLFTVMGVDPAFAVDGDKCAVAVGQVGVFENGVRGVRVAELKYLHIDGLSSVPVSYQLEAQIAQIRLQFQVPIDHIFMDSTGTQALDDCVEAEAGEYGINRISFAARATADPVSDSDDTPSNKRFGSIRGQMWYKVREFARYGQLKNLPEIASEEFSARVLQPKKLIDIESKKDYKRRTGGRSSPDAADSVALMLYGCFKLGLTPGATIHHRHGRTNHNPVTTTADYEETNYSNEEDYS